MKPRPTFRPRRRHAGFSMAETLVASLVGITTIAVTTPMFVAQRQYNIDSEVMNGAKSVATRCLEMMRQIDPASLYLSNNFNQVTPACNIPAAERVQLGKPYQVDTRVRIAVIDPDAMTNGGAFGSYQCTGAGNDNANSSGSRCLSVRVRWNNKVIYTVDTVYARLSD